MDLTLFETMEAPELRTYLKILLYHYRLVDALWFLKVAEKYDQAAAEGINEEIWGRLSEKAAKDLLSGFQLRANGLKGFVEAIQYLPWGILTGYDIEERPDEVLLSVPSCPPQVARRKHGMGEFVCKHMHRGSFEGFARVVDPRIRVQCLFAPPDPHPDNLFCRWRFYLEEDAVANG